MIRFLILIPAFIIAIIVSISLYLQPDDLISCNDQLSTSESCQPVDAIVAVSGGDTNARTDEAIKLYKNHWADTLIFSGAAIDKSGPSNAAAMRSHAEEMGVPSSAILIDESSDTTKQNAENTNEILSNNSIKTVILVTSGYHQRRASLEFKAITKGVTILNHPVASDQDWSMWWWTSPRGWSLAMSEISKIVLFYFGVSQ